MMPLASVLSTLSPIKNNFQIVGHELAEHMVIAYHISKTEYYSLLYHVEGNFDKGKIWQMVKLVVGGKIFGKSFHPQTKN